MDIILRNVRLEVVTKSGGVAVVGALTKEEYASYEEIGSEGVEYGEDWYVDAYGDLMVTIATRLGKPLDWQDSDLVEANVVWDMEVVGCATADLDFKDQSAVEQERDLYHVILNPEEFMFIYEEFGDRNRTAIEERVFEAIKRADRAHVCVDEQAARQPDEAE